MDLSFIHHQPHQPHPLQILTHSLAAPYSAAGITFTHHRPHSVNDVLIVPVRLSSTHAATQQQANLPLPRRPVPRTFLQRLKTRGTREPKQKYKAVKMPRREYKTFFARDGRGRYVGTEPERLWGEAELEMEFGRFRDKALGGILSCGEEREVEFGVTVDEMGRGVRG